MEQIQHRVDANKKGIIFLVNLTRISDTNIYVGGLRITCVDHVYNPMHIRRKG